MSINWFHSIFIHKISASLKANLTDVLKQEYQSFISSISPSEYPLQKAELDSWYNSKEGQAELLRLISDFTLHLFKMSNVAMPAHDARHAIFKVPFYGLKHILAEEYINCDRLGLFGCLAHDYGRWAEEQVYGHPTEGSTHSRLSFVLTREFLEDYDIPTTLKNEILFAAIKHTTGANESDNPIVKITVTSDRDQLVGPEFVLRHLHHPPIGDKSKYVADSQLSDNCDLTMIAKLNLLKLPGPLHILQGRAELAKMSATFIGLVAGESALNFYYDKFKSNSNCLAHSVLIEQLEYFRQVQYNWTPNWEIPANIALSDILSANNLSPIECYKQESLNKLDNLTSQELIRMSTAIQWIDIQRKLLDEAQLSDILAMKSQFEEPWIQWFLSFLESNW